MTIRRLCSARTSREAGLPGRRRWLGRAGERGVALLETALVAPMILLLVFGVLEFGLVLNDMSSMRQGVRDAARQGSVGNYGTTTSCGLSGVSPATSNDMRELMCLTKQQVDMGNGVRVAIKFYNEDLSGPATDGFAAGNGLVVCTAATLRSVTGMYAPLLNDKEIKAEAVFRMEQTSSVAQTAGSETDPTGMNWSWCGP